MTAEERFERIEHVTAMLVEERRKDREEYKQLWRDTQRQISEAGMRISELGIKIADLGDESREGDRRLERRIEQLAEESRTADARLGQRIDALGQRIDSLVSAMGEFISRQTK